MKKSELLNWLLEEHQQWEGFLTQIGPARMEQPGVNGDWSMKDLVAHLTIWNRFLVSRLNAAEHNEPEPPPPWPNHLQTEDEINAWIYESNQGRPVREILDGSQQVFQQLLSVIEGLSDDTRIERMWHLVWFDDKYYPAGEFYDHFHDDHEADVRAWLARVENDSGNKNIISWRRAIWKQFGAAIDMLDIALRACPDELWQERLWDHTSERPEFSQFWYIAYHALFWLDLYLTGAEEGFTPPTPFTLTEMDADDALPEKPYTKNELQSYLEYGRKKCQTTIEALNDIAAHRHCRFGWGEVSFAELLLYNMRHVQEHATQLSLFLGQKVGSAPGWVARAKSSGAQRADVQGGRDAHLDSKP